MAEPSPRHLTRGLALERDGRYAEAAAAYREAAELDPSDVGAQLRLGLVLRVLGRDEEANETFRTVLVLQAEEAG
jgi:Flp pilus assembly protein TadD